jgi:hypothetical protein
LPQGRKARRRPRHRGFSTASRHRPCATASNMQSDDTVWAFSILLQTSYNTRSKIKRSRVHNRSKVQFRFKLKLLRIFPFKTKRRPPIFFRIFHTTIHEQASHTPLDGDFRPSQNMLLGARCGLADDRRRLVWKVSTKLENPTPTL